MSENYKIITTEDGSHSLHNVELNESYHSLRGAMGESLHVFIEAGLKFIHQEKKIKNISVFEVGFGTGLNAWLTWQYAIENNLPVEYKSIETSPLSKDIYSGLNYGEPDKFFQLHECPWEKYVAFENFSLEKSNQSLEEIELHEVHFDLIYFDAFAPSKQPEIWSIENLEKCFRSLKPGGILVTYCAQGQFKRNLAALGFEVQTLPGALGKKEMVRGVKLGNRW